MKNQLLSLSFLWLSLSAGQGQCPVAVAPATASFCAGSAVGDTFAVVSTPLANTHIWEMQLGTAWSPVSNGFPQGAVYDLATPGRMVVKSITLAGTYTYRYRTTNCPAGQAVSGSLGLTVIPAAPPPVITTNTGGTLITCANNGTLTLTGTGAGITSYQWTASNGGNIVSGGNTATVTVNAAGTYTLQVANAAGCTATASTNITLNQNPPTVNIANNPPTNTLTCQVASILLTATAMLSSGLPGATVGYKWANGPTTPTLTVNAAGTYAVTVTDSKNECTAAAGQTIADNYVPPTATISPNPTDARLTCTNPSVKLTANPATGVNYRWSNNAPPIREITVTNPDTYTVSVTYQTGSTSTVCTGTAQQQVTIDPAKFTVAITSNSNFLYCAPNDKVDLSFVYTSGNPSQPRYEWSGPGNFFATTATVTVSVKGTYTLKVTDGSNGCSATASIFIDENKTPPIANAGLPQAFCWGGSATLGPSPSNANYNYQWQQGNPNFSLTGGNSSNAPVIQYNGGNPYTANSNQPQQTTVTLTVTDNTNLCTSTAAVTVTVRPRPDVTVTNTESSGNGPNPNATICSGAPVTLGISPTVTGTASYAWSTGASGASTAPPTPMATNASLYPTYTVTVTNGAAQGGCTSTSSITLTVHPNPKLNLSSTEASGNDDNDGKICAGTSITLNAGLPGMTTYAWRQNNNPVGGNAQTLTLSNLPALPAGAVTQVSLSVTDNNGCTDTKTYPVTVFALPSPDITVTESTGPPQLGDICAGDAVALSAGNGSSTCQWAWGGNGQSADCNLSVPALQSKETYAVTVTNGNGCSNSSSTAVTVRKNPTAVIGGAPSPYEAGKLYSFAGNNSQPGDKPISTWDWAFFPGATPGTSSMTNPTNIRFDQAGLANICLEVTDSNTCKHERCLQVDVQPPNNAGTLRLPGDLLAALGRCDGTLYSGALEFTPGVGGILSTTYSLVSDPPQYATFSLPDPAKPDFSVTFQNPTNAPVKVRLTAKVTVQLFSGPVESQDIREFTVNPRPDVLSFSADPDALCAGGDAQLRVQFSAPGNYDMDISGFPNGSLNNIQTDTNGLYQTSVTPVSASTYRITEVTDRATGCFRALDRAATVTVNPNPGILALQEDCLDSVSIAVFQLGFTVGGSTAVPFTLNLSVTAIDTTKSFQATLPVNGTTFRDTLPVGIYAVEVVDANGCRVAENGDHECNCDRFNPGRMGSATTFVFKDEESFEVKTVIDPQEVKNALPFILYYVLHEGSGNQMINPIDRVLTLLNQNTVEFDYPDPALIDFNKTYYVSSVVGNLTDATGFPIVSDTTCFVVAAGTPVKFLMTVSATPDAPAPEKQFVLYPNPNGGTFTLRLDEAPERSGLLVQVFDMTGRLVYRSPWEAQAANYLHEVVLEGAASGVYHCQVLGDGGFRKIKSFVLQR